MLITCFSDIHNMLSMLSMPTTLRRTVAMGVDENLKRFGPADLTIVGGDSVSDYPSWTSSGWLPYRNFLDIKAKQNAELARGTKSGRLLYVAGNHDYACGEGVKAGYNDRPYNSAEYYETGPMKKSLGVLAEKDACWGYSERLGKQAGAYLLGFHYVVEGMDFYGLNLHPDEIYSHQGMLPGSVVRFSPDALRWLKKRLAETDPDGWKPTFVISHIPPERSTDPENRAMLYDAYRGHRNIFHLFGDTHGIVRNGFTAQQVYLYDNDAVTRGDNQRTSGDFGTQDYLFTALLMGTSRYDEAYESDRVVGDGGEPGMEAHERTATPLIAQGLVIRTFSDRIEFQMCNHAKGRDGQFRPTDQIEPYIAYFRAHRAL